MELISVPGYTHEEKQHIARFHLIPKQLKEHGLNGEVLVITNDAIKNLISKYTREAGVRNLERRVGAVCRAVAVKVVEKNNQSSLIEGDDESRLHPETAHEVGHGSQISHNINNQEVLMTPPPELPFIVDENALEDILGPAIFENELASRVGMPGVALGLAWTPTGGEVMIVEATKMEGDGQLILTGQLGDVMKESATIALNWLRSHSTDYGLPFNKNMDLMENTDVHIHFPAGAVGKDGPSAGITIVTSLVSLFTGRIVSPDTAMTGEMTLRGLVLPVSDFCILIPLLLLLVLFFLSIYLVMMILNVYHSSFLVQLSFSSFLSSLILYPTK